MMADVRNKDRLLTIIYFMGVIDMASYFYSKLDIQSQATYRRIVNAINTRKVSVKVGHMDAWKFQEIVKGVNYDHPEFFFVNFQEIKMLGIPRAGLVWQIYYRYRGRALERMVQDIESEIQRILDKAIHVRQASALDKCRWIHNYFARNIRYNEAALKNSALYPDSYTIEGVFKQKTAVCEGIAKAVTLLGDRLGLDLPTVYGQGISDQIGLGDSHAWNLFLCNGICAHLDVTWDICLSRPLRFTRYDYFVLSDKDISVDHIYDRKIVAECMENNGLSYFEMAGRLLTDHRQCERYVESRLRQKETVVYFKYRPAKGIPKGIEKKMDDMVMQKARECFKAGFTINMAPNLSQGVFFYRITF